MFVNRKPGARRRDYAKSFKLIFCYNKLKQINNDIFVSVKVNESAYLA